jgi:hypothetical protein
MGQSSPMSEEDLADLKREADMLFMSRPSTHGVNLVLKGMTTIDGKNTYVVDVVKGETVKSSMYFDAETGQQIRSEQTTETPQGPMTVVVDYLEYKTVSGYTLPSKTKQSVAGQEYVFEVTEFEINKRIGDAEFAIK